MTASAKRIAGSLALSVAAVAARGGGGDAVTVIALPAPAAAREAPRPDSSLQEQGITLLTLPEPEGRPSQSPLPSPRELTRLGVTVVTLPDPSSTHARTRTQVASAESGVTVIALPGSEPERSRPDANRSETIQASRLAERAPPEPSPGEANAKVPPGQWVYTDQYGWVWMPYEEAYGSTPPSGSGEPSMYLYAPSSGWAWLAAPWVWGWGPWPYFGSRGPWHFAWYARGWWQTPQRWHLVPSRDGRSQRRPGLEPGSHAGLAREPRGRDGRTAHGSLFASTRR